MTPRGDFGPQSFLEALAWDWFDWLGAGLLVLSLVLSILLMRGRGR